MEPELSIRPLKNFAMSRMAEYPLVKQMILDESDRVTAMEFASKSRFWLQLLRKELER